MDTNPRHDLRATALGYADAGLSVIPLATMAKTPAIRRWLPYAMVRPDRPTVAKWFGRDRNIGIVCGEVSGGLYVLDFDDADSYERWRTVQPDLAPAAPTVITARGRHVYLRWHPCPPTSKPATGIDLRGERSYVVAPPSVHPTGMEYTWEIALANEIPEVDPAIAIGGSAPKAADPDKEPPSTSPTFRATLDAAASLMPLVTVPDGLAELEAVARLAKAMDELHRGGRWFLGCRDAATIAQCASHDTAARYIRELVRIGYLRRVHPGDTRRKLAATYQWLGGPTGGGR